MINLKFEIFIGAAQRVKCKSETFAFPSTQAKKGSSTPRRAMGECTKRSIVRGLPAVGYPSFNN